MKGRVLHAAAIVALLVVLPARGTVLVELSLEQLSQASTAIVRGRVVGQESRWNSTRTGVVTLTTIEIEESLKGHPGAVVVIQQPGGRVGNIHLRVPGTVRFLPGARYFLFLESGREAARYRLVGMGQGAYRIFRDPRTREERVVRPFGNRFLGGPPDAKGPRAASPTTSTNDFHRAVSAALQAPLVVPAGTRLPIVVQETAFRGAGSLTVEGRTTAAVFPSATAVIPAGSVLEGTARRVSGRWLIRWRELSVRGVKVRINAASEPPASAPLRGQVVVAEVR